MLKRRVEVDAEAEITRGWLMTSALAPQPERDL
jgi:hypothetical protein